MAAGKPRGLRAPLWLAVISSTAQATEPSAEQLAERTRQVAEILGVQSIAEPTPGPAVSGGDAHEATERLRRCTASLAKALQASLLIDATLARIQREQFAAANASKVLSSRNNRVITTWNLAAILVGSTTTAVGTGLQFGDQTSAQVGDGLIIGGAVVAAAFSVLALVRKDRGHPPRAIETAFLARLLGHPPPRGSDLPQVVWRYLDTVLIGERSSSQKQLVDRFVEEGSLVIGPSPAARHQVEWLSRPTSVLEVVSSSWLDLRANMLDDLRTRVVELKVDLERLMAQGGASCGGR